MVLFGNVFDHYSIFVPFGHVSFYGCLCYGLYLCWRYKNLSFFTLFTTAFCVISSHHSMAIRVKMKSISIFKIDSNKCMFCMRNHSSLNCKLVYGHKIGVWPVLHSLNSSMGSKCIGTSFALYLRHGVILNWSLLECFDRVFSENSAASYQEQFNWNCDIDYYGWKYRKIEHHIRPNPTITRLNFTETSHVRTRCDCDCYAYEYSKIHIYVCAGLYVYLKLNRVFALALQISRVMAFTA